MTCTRCKKKTTGFQLFDYCDICGENLCGLCMSKGCCGHTPAISGQKADYEDELIEDEEDESGAP